MLRNVAVALCLTTSVADGGGAVPHRPPVAMSRLAAADASLLEVAEAAAQGAPVGAALGHLALVYVGLGDHERAVALVGTIKAEEDRAFAMAELVAPLAAAGDRERAETLSAQATSMALRARTNYPWSGIAERLAKAGQFARALDIAETREKPEDVASAVNQILRVWTDGEGALPPLVIIERAERVERKLPSTDTTGQLRVHVAMGLAAHGEFARALEIHERIKEPHDREDASGELAVLYAKRDLFDKALAMLERAGDYYGDIARMRVADEYRRAGDEKSALRLLDEVTRPILASKKKDRERCSECDVDRLCDAASVFGKLGARSRAADLLDAAFVLARATGKPGSRDRAYERLVVTAIEVGLLDRAIAVAENNDFDLRRVQQLERIGLAAFAAGESARVGQVLELLANSPTAEAGPLVAAYASLGRAHTEAGQPERALALLGRARAAASTARGFDAGGDAVRDLAVGYAELGRFATALEIVAGMGRSFHAPMALADVAAFFVRSGRPLDEAERRIVESLAGASKRGGKDAKKAVNPLGWEIPGLDGSSHAWGPSTREGLFDKIPRTQTARTARNDVRFRPPPELVGAPAEGTAPLEFQVFQIHEYSINGQRFAYVVTANELHRDAAAGETRKASRMDAFVYYDEDGDGLFETVEVGRGTEDTRIPDWVRAR